MTFIRQFMPEDGAIRDHAEDKSKPTCPVCGKNGRKIPMKKGGDLYIHKEVGECGGWKIKEECLAK